MIDPSRFPSGAMQRILFRFMDPTSQLSCEAIRCESCGKKEVDPGDARTGSFFQVRGYARRHIREAKDALGAYTHVVLGICSGCLEKPWETNSIPSDINGGAHPPSVGYRCSSSLM